MENHVEEFIRFTGQPPIAWAKTLINRPPVIATIKGLLKKGWWTKIRGKTIFVEIDKISKIAAAYKKQGVPPYRKFAKLWNKTTPPPKLGLGDRVAEKFTEAWANVKGATKQAASQHVKKYYLKGLLGGKKKYFIAPVAIPVFYGGHQIATDEPPRRRPRKPKKFLTKKKKSE